jgi:hypothetical protein
VHCYGQQKYINQIIFITQTPKKFNLEQILYTKCGLQGVEAMRQHVVRPRQRGTVGRDGGAAAEVRGRGGARCSRRGERLRQHWAGMWYVLIVHPVQHKHQGELCASSFLLVFLIQLFQFVF